MPEPDSSSADTYAEEASIAGDAALEGRIDEAAQISASIGPSENENVASDIEVARAKARGMSVDMRRQIATAARAAQARRSFAHFFRQAWKILEPDTELEWNWHHQLVCDVVQGVLVDWLRKKRDRSYKQRARNVVFNLPPGSAKSRLISVAAVAWMWLHYPMWSVACLSANPDVAVRDASLCRDLITSDWYRFTFGITWVIRDDVDAKGRFKNTRGGERLSRGLTSKVVGNRTHAILIDDPNDMHEVMSEASRREVNHRFDTSIYNRLNDVRIDVRILIQQRGHEDDLTGHWTRKDPTVLLVALPVEFDPERRAITPWGCDPRKAANDNIHEQRYTTEVIAEARLTLGSYGFEGQYNQRAGSFEGGMFKRTGVRFFKLASNTPLTLDAVYPRPHGTESNPPAVVLPEKRVAAGAHWTERIDVDWWMLTVDATFGSTSESASNVGLGIFAGKGPKRFLFEDRSKPMTVPQTIEAIKQALKDYPLIRRVLIEKKAGGGPILQLMENEVDGLIPFEPKGDKQQRAFAMTPSYEAGNLYVLEGMPWVTPYVVELSLFPRAPKNDRVDMTSQLFQYAAVNLNIAAQWDALSA